MVNGKQSKNFLLVDRLPDMDMVFLINKNIFSLKNMFFPMKTCFFFFLQKHVFLNEIKNHNQLGNDLVISFSYWLQFSWLQTSIWIGLVVNGKTFFSVNHLPYMVW